MKLVPRRICRRVNDVYRTILCKRWGRVVCPVPNVEWARVGARVYWHFRKDGSAVITRHLVKTLNGRMLSGRVCRTRGRRLAWREMASRVRG